jgi:hypothetical protein
MAVSQSNTQWVKKGDIVNGKKVKKGYVAQKGKPEKRVTNKIRLVQDTAKRGKAGDVVQTKKGRYVKANRKPLSKGGGYTGKGPGKGTDKPTTPTETDKPKPTTETPDQLPSNVSGAGAKGKPQLGGKGKGLEGLSKMDRNVYNMMSSNTDAPNMADKRKTYESGSGGGSRYEASRQKAKTERDKRNAPVPGEFNTAGAAAARLRQDLIQASRDRKGYTRKPQRGDRFTVGRTTYRWDGRQWVDAS